MVVARSDFDGFGSQPVASGVLHQKMGIGDGGGELLQGFVASGCTGSSASGYQPTNI